MKNITQLKKEHDDAETCMRFADEMCLKGDPTKRAQSEKDLNVAAERVETAIAATLTATPMTSLDRALQADVWNDYREDIEQATTASKLFGLILIL